MKEASKDNPMLNLKQLITEAIARCALCQKLRGKANIALERHSISAATPFAVFEIDFIKGLPMTEAKLSAICAITDSFSRYYACETESSEVVTQCLLEVYGKYGFPQFYVPMVANSQVGQ